MAKRGEVLSHWHHSVDDFHTSSMDFYTAVEEAMGRREIPRADLSRVSWKESGLGAAKREYLRVKRGRFCFNICAAPFGKGFFFSWWLTRVRTGGGFVVLFIFILTFLVLWSLWTSIASNFGNIGVVTSQLLWPLFILILGLLVRDGKLPGEDTIIDTPFLGGLYEIVFSPTTFYKLDTALMFRDSVSKAVTEVLTDIRNEKGLRALTESELQPKDNFIDR